MVVFWILAALMTALAVAFVLVPLLRPRAAPVAAPTADQANLEVLRSQRREIDDDVAAGTLPADARAEVLDELMERAAQDLAQAEPPPAPAAPSRAWRTAAGAALAIPLLAFGLYAVLGNPRAADPALLAAMKGGKADEQQIVAMVESLARKVRERPDDAEGWALLARSMAALNRFPEAVEAYAHLSKLVPNDAQVLADYADVLGMAQGRSLKGKPYELVQQALRIEPRNRKALAIAGTAALDDGDYPAAQRYWQTLAEEIPADTDDGKQIQAVLDEIRTRAAQAGKALPATAPKVASNAAAAPSGKTVTGSVALAPELASQVAGTETLFVFARAEKGPRVPLAVVRATARELPMKFALDDSQAMAPGMNISSASSILVEARISRSGNAVAQPGDLVGTSHAVKPGAREVRIVVDRKLP